MNRTTAMQVILTVALFLVSVGIGLAAVLGSSSNLQQGLTQGWERIVSKGINNDTDLIGINNYVEYDGYLYAAVYNISDGAEIWRTQDLAHWELIAQNGLGNPRNNVILLFVVNGKLYAGTFNDEDGAEIWVSEDGVTFNQIVSGGLGDEDNIGVGLPVVYGDKILLPIQNGQIGAIEDGAEIWLTRDGRNFERIPREGLWDPSNFMLNIYPELFKGYLYLGTYNSGNGGEVWRSKDGLRWERVVDNGFDDRGNSYIMPQLVFNDYLYVVTFNLNGLNVFRTNDGETWEKVVENGFINGMGRNVFGVLSEINGKLYLTTASTPTIGAFQLWRSDDGKSWEQVGSTGFGNENNHFAGIFKGSDGRLYLSTLNGIDGVEAWRSEDGEEWEMIFKEDRGYPSHTGAGLYEFKNHLYMLIYDVENGIEIWKYTKPLVTTTTTTGETVTFETTKTTPTTETFTTTRTVGITVTQQPTTATAITTQEATRTFTSTPTGSEPFWSPMLYALIGVAAAGVAVALFYILKLRPAAHPPPPPPPPPPP